MTPRADLSVAEIEARLLARMDALARTLAPKGQRHGNEWVALNPARADSKPGSFSINLKTGAWADFAAGAGQKKMAALGLVTYLATGGDFNRAILWAKDWLGISGRAPSPAEAAKQSAEIRAAQERAAREAAVETEKKRRIAQAMWLNAKPLDGHDPASRYLRARGIDVTAFPDGPPRALRWSNACKANPEGVEVPAMLAAMSREGIGFAAVHRTYLSQASGVWGKAFGRKSKRILGPKSGASIRLINGTSNKALKDAPAGEWVAIGEGVENVLAAALAKPGLRMIAAGTLENVAKIVLPLQMGGVHIIADNDKRGSEAEAALEKVVNVLAFERGFDIEIIRAPAGFKDFNDVLLGKRMAA